MDILCTRCGEPWDVYSLTDDMTPEEAKDLKAGRGCPCCAGKTACLLEESCDECGNYQNYRCRINCYKPINQTGREAQAAMAEVLGDDIDGLAAEMDDLGLV